MPWHARAFAMTEFFTPGDDTRPGISLHHSKFADGNFYSQPPHAAPRLGRPVTSACFS
jgi:hypothetical protein